MLQTLTPPPVYILGEDHLAGERKVWTCFAVTINRMDVKHPGHTTFVNLNKSQAET